MILGLVGATGVVGGEIVSLLQERRVAIAQLRLFASDGSAGSPIDWFEDEIMVEALEPGSLADCDLVIYAAPRNESLLAELRAADVALVDLSGALEADEEVRLVAGSISTPGKADPHVAIARGISVGIALVLRALSQEVQFQRASIVVLEGASGLGRPGLDTLTEQTVRVLNAMDGGALDGGVFPQALAFDCVPQVGELTDDGGTDEEERLAFVLRRLLNDPELELAVTRVRVPIYVGSLATLHLDLSAELSAARAERLLRESPEIDVRLGADLPSPRGASGRDQVVVGRIRAAGSQLALVLAQDDLRRGAALGAVETVEMRLADA